MRALYSGASFMSFLDANNPLTYYDAMSWFHVIGVVCESEPLVILTNYLLCATLSPLTSVLLYNTSFCIGGSVGVSVGG